MANHKPRQHRRDGDNEAREVDLCDEPLVGDDAVARFGRACAKSCQGSSAQKCEDRIRDSVRRHFARWPKKRLKATIMKKAE